MVGKGLIAYLHVCIMCMLCSPVASIPCKSLFCFMSNLEYSSAVVIQLVLLCHHRARLCRHLCHAGAVGPLPGGWEGFPPAKVGWTSFSPRKAPVHVYLWSVSKLNYKKHAEQVHRVRYCLFAIWCNYIVYVQIFSQQTLQNPIKRAQTNI